MDELLRHISDEIEFMVNQSRDIGYDAGVFDTLSVMTDAAGNSKHSKAIRMLISRVRKEMNEVEVDSDDF
jgi:hypothetical protein